MDAGKTITEIKLPEQKPLRMADWEAANLKHDETWANSPWFRLWKRQREQTLRVQAPTALT